MTLRRKNIAPHGPLVVTYGVMLTAGFCISTYDHYLHGSWLMVNTLAHVACALRLGLGVHKYLLWAGVGAALHFARPHLVVSSPDEPLGMRTGAWLASTAVVLALGVRKVKRDYAREAKAAADGANGGKKAD